MNELFELLEKYTMRDGFSSCWHWTGYIEPNGYGRVNYHGKNYRIHRAIMIALGKIIPSTLHIDHLCHNRACWNPMHLEVKTQSENLKNRSKRYI